MTLWWSHQSSRDYTIDMVTYAYLFEINLKKQKNLLFRDMKSSSPHASFTVCISIVRGVI